MTVTTIIIIAIVLATVAALSLTLAKTTALSPAFAAIARTVANFNNITCTSFARTVATCDNTTGSSEDNKSDVMAATYIKRLIELCRDSKTMLDSYDEGLAYLHIKCDKRGIDFFHFFSDAKVYVDERNYRVKFDGTIDGELVHLDFCAFDYIPTSFSFRDDVNYFISSMLPSCVKDCVVINRRNFYINVYHNSLDYDEQTITCHCTEYDQYSTWEHIRKTSFITGETSNLKACKLYESWDANKRYERRKAIANFSF